MGGISHDLFSFLIYVKRWNKKHKLKFPTYFSVEFNATAADVVRRRFETFVPSTERILLEEARQENVLLSGNNTIYTRLNL